MTAGIPTSDNPRPGIPTTEMCVFYINYSIKWLAYFEILILTFWLTDAGYHTWEVSYVWTASILGSVTTGLILGSFSDFFKTRIQLLSFSAVVVGVCDISLPFIVKYQPLSFLCVVYFIRVFFMNAQVCAVWVADWLPDESLAKNMQTLTVVQFMASAFGAGLALVLYSPVGPNTIFTGHGVLSLVTGVTWCYHKDNPLGMETAKDEKVCENMPVLHGPLQRMLPEKGCFLLGWPLFIICTLCACLEATIVSGIYASGMIYADELGVSYYAIAAIPFSFMFILFTAQVCARVISSRLVGAILTAAVVGSILPTTLGTTNESTLLVIQYVCLISSNYFIVSVIMSLLMMLFNEAWKARMKALFYTIRNSFEVVGLYGSAAVFNADPDSLLTFLMVCSLCMYALFEVASWSLPPENTTNSGDHEKKNYGVLA